MPAFAPSMPERRGLAAVALAGLCAGAAIGAVGGGWLASGHDGPAGALRAAFESTAPALRPRSTPSFSWAFLLPRPRLQRVAGGRELDCLADAVYYEARGESAEGQAAVAQVVVNRTRRSGFPKSICGVVFQRAGRACQFSFACDGSITTRRDGEAWMRARRVAARALEGYALADVGDATHFHVAGLRVAWGGGLLQVARIGAHVFYGLGHARGHAAPAFQTPLAPPAPTPAAAILPPPTLDPPATPAI